MNVLDLFSGIGGFSLGLERAGFKTVAFCEIDPYCRAVLRKHWPDVPQYDDIRKLDATGIRADVVCGGFPCQPHSSASHGRKLGMADPRWLWPEMRRVIQESKPTWILGENVAQFDGLALESMASDMEADGYEIAPTLEIPACAVRLDHWRPRNWFIGYSYRNGKSRRAFDAEASGMQGNRPHAGNSGAAHGISGRMDNHRRRVIGNSVACEIPEIIGRAIMQAAGEMTNQQAAQPAER